MSLSPHEKFMRMALVQAQLGLDQKEFPVGAVLVRGEEVIHLGYNQDRAGGYLAHAEMSVLLAADSGKLKFSDRQQMKLYSTLEPCLMCMSAAMSFFVGEVIYALDAPLDGGAVISQLKFGGSEIPNFKMPPLVKGVLESESKALIEKYISVGENKVLIQYAKSLVRSV
jgi:tRNA(adenine34) deaminase